MVEESSDELLFSSLPLEYFRQGFCVVFDVFREGFQRFKQIVFFTSSYLVSAKSHSNVENEHFPFLDLWNVIKNLLEF